MKAIFEDFESAAQYACDEAGEDFNCDILDMKFPIENALVPIVIELVVKELIGVKYQPRDTQNNAADDASNPVSQPKQQ